MSFLDIFKPNSEIMALRLLVTKQEQEIKNLNADKIYLQNIIDNLSRTNTKTNKTNIIRTNKLSPQQQLVYDLIIAGNDIKSIMEKTNLSYKQISVIKVNIRKKLGNII